MPSNKNATLRYKAIDSLLCSEEWHTIEEITRVCEDALSEDSGTTAKVSRVTIYNDLDFLSRLDGVKLERQAGRPVRYRYARDSRTFNGTMVPSSSYADLAIALEYLESVSGLVKIDKAIERIKRQLDGNGRDLQKFISFQSNPRLRNSNLLWALYRHIREENPLRLRYNASYMEVKDIDFQPWYLKQYNNRWFLMGWAYRISDGEGERLDVGLRNLAVDRIEPEADGKLYIDVSRKRTRNIRINTPGTESYIDFDEYFSDIVGVTRKDDVEPVEILLRADIQEKAGKYDWNRMATKPVHHSQESWTEDGHGYVRLKVKPNNELYTVLLGYEALEVASPAPVRDEMIRRITALLSHYGSDRTD